MSERPTLSVAVPCPTCGGTKIWTQAWRIDDVEGESSGKCPKCTDGTIRQAVSCAGCKYYFVSNEPSDPTYYGWCDHPDMNAMDVLPDWGCLSWQAKA